MQTLGSFINSNYSFHDITKSSAEKILGKHISNSFNPFRIILSPEGESIRIRAFFLNESEEKLEYGSAIPVFFTSVCTASFYIQDLLEEIMSNEIFSGNLEPFNFQQIDSFNTTNNPSRTVSQAQVDFSADNQFAKLEEDKKLSNTTSGGTPEEILGQREPDKSMSGFIDFN